ncbi:MAG: hypothetical protein WAV05_09690 [Anaerolineales bacterium]
MAEKTEFLPFHAINEFMRPDFRLNVIRETLTSQSFMDEACMKDLNQQIKKRVTIPGFRNSDKAPALVKVLPTSKAFENHPELVAAVLTCWAENHSELRKQVYDLLASRNWPIFTGSESMDVASLTIDMIKEWPIFPIEVNRSKLPGFFIHWLKGEEFDVLYNDFTKLYPNSDASIDKVSLMVVWLTMRLPYQVDIEINNSDKDVTADQTP